jgi:putative transposase
MHSTGNAAVAGRCKKPDSTIQQYVDRYNYLRLHSAIGYVTPKDMLAGHQQEIQAERDRKLDAAKEQRKNRRQGAA